MVGHPLYNDSLDGALLFEAGHALNLACPRTVPFGLTVFYFKQNLTFLQSALPLEMTFKLIHPESGYQQVNRNNQTSVV